MMSSSQALSLSNSQHHSTQFLCWMTHDWMKARCFNQAFWQQGSGREPLTLVLIFLSPCAFFRVSFFSLLTAPYLLQRRAQSFWVYWTFSRKKTEKDALLPNKGNLCLGEEKTNCKLMRWRWWIAPLRLCGGEENLAPEWHQAFLCRWNHKEHRASVRRFVRLFVLYLFV